MSESTSNAIGNPFHIYLYNADRSPLPISFETAIQRLSGVPRLYAEPDGSLVWCGENPAGSISADPPWRIFGMLYDFADQLQYVDLRGSCPKTHWTQLCEMLQVPSDASTLQLPDQRLISLRQFESETW
ncbi:MAG: hypothetical protein AAFP90_11790 [Planctomycetota bacterium]